MAIHTYKDLTVWQRGIELVASIYQLTASFPREEQFGLTSQMRRAAVSIPSNIAEGRFRGTRNDFRQFLRIAYGSGAELETQLIIAKKIFPDRNINYSESEALLNEIMRMLNTILSSMKQPQA